MSFDKELFDVDSTKGTSKNKVLPRRTYAADNDFAASAQIYKFYDTKVVASDYYPKVIVYDEPIMGKE
jgi:hypothetical protein